MTCNTCNRKSERAKVLMCVNGPPCARPLWQDAAKFAQHVVLWHKGARMVLLANAAAVAGMAHVYTASSIRKTQQRISTYSLSFVVMLKQLLEQTILI